MEFTIKQKCDFIGELEKGEPARAKDIGELIGLDAFNAGQLTKDLRSSGYIEWASKAKHLYRTTERGKKYKANPPAEIKAAGGTTTPPVTETVTKTVTKTVLETVPETVLPQTPALEEKSDEQKVPKKVGDINIPSQMDTFKSIAEQLGISKAEEAKGGSSLPGIINFVERTADMDDLDSIEGALIKMNVAAHLRKRWLTLYAQSLPAKNKRISPELAEMLELDEGRDRPSSQAKPKTQMYNVINGQICADAEGEHTFSRAVQKVMAEKPASSDQASSLITALMPLLDKEPPPPPPPPDTTFFQSLQTRMEQLADERNKAQLDALRAEMKSGQRPPEADAQIQALATSIQTLREELHKQQLERLQEQHAAAINLMTDKLTRLEQQVLASIQGKQVDSKFGLMSEGLKDIFGELSGARKDFKEVAPTFLGRGREKTVRTPEQKAGFDQGVEQAVELEKRARELEDELFFGKGS